MKKIVDSDFKIQDLIWLARCYTFTNSQALFYSAHLATNITIFFSQVFLSFEQINKQIFYMSKKDFFSTIWRNQKFRWKKIVKKLSKHVMSWSFISFFLFSVGYQNALGYNANGQYGYTYGGGIGLGPKFAHSNYINQASLPDYSNKPYVLNPYSSR